MTESRERSVQVPWNALVAAGLCGVWILLSLSRWFFEVLPGSTTWYPPAALVAAACLVWGGRALIPLVAGGFIAAEVLGHPGEKLWQVLLLSFGVKASYWLAAIVLRKLRFDPRFGRPSDVARFTLVMGAAGGLAACLAATYGISTGALHRADALEGLAVFWMGDVMAVLALTPMLLAGALVFDRNKPARKNPATIDRQAALQILSLPAALLFAVLTAPRLGVLAFGVAFVPLGWIAVTQGVTLAAVWSASLDVGAVFTRASGNTPLDNLELQTLIATLAITGLLLGSMSTERQRAGEQLAESEERYRVLVELLPDPLLVHRGGVILLANEAAAKTLGAASPQALHGVHLDAIATPDSRARIRERMALLYAGQAVPLTEHKLARLDGTGQVHAESVSIPISFDGSPAALTVARDVTVSRKLADELRHAQRLESVGQLAGGVAHDFNNLLSVMLSCGEMLVDRLPADSELHALALETLQAAERGAVLTRQLLTFSRKQPTQEKPVRLDEIARGTETLLRRLITSPVNIRFAHADTGVVLADGGQLEQVILNLAVNARDAMPHGGDLTIETGSRRIDAPEARWPGLPPGAYATLFMRDGGHGIPPEIRAHIFEPFFTTKEIGKGTGLGLATVYGIIKRANGHIYVESEPGAGTLFAIFLPHV